MDSGEEKDVLGYGKSSPAQWEYDSLEKIAEAIEASEVQVISFDVFDTLILRPLERSTDLFELLDRDFGKMSSAQVSFQKLRTEAEAILRRRILRKELLQEDICLDDIYKVLEEDLGVDAFVADRMKRLEFETELKLCKVRKSGAFLFRRALATGKPVIVISDMYLSAAQITAILKKNGYEGMKAVLVSSDLGKRKITGNLYDAAAKQMQTAPGEIFHIGDDVEADCIRAAARGFRTAWLPKALEVYDSRGCAHQVEKICGDLTDWEAAKNSVGIGSMRAMAAAKYFDNPFRPFEKASDYNGDPYFVGYGALGMEVLALVRWLADQIRRDQVKHMIFMARDGYLPMKVYESYHSYHPELPKAQYLPVSRLAMLPVMIQAPEDLFDLPMDISYQTPRKLLRLLAFCTKEKGELPDIPLDETFSRDTFQRFIASFIKKGYDRRKHEQAIAHISEYLLNNDTAPVTKDAALFDSGYSGRIPAAIRKATGVPLRVYYFHGDSRSHFRYERKAGMKIRAFFDFNPYMESSIREYSYLEPSASCVGYTKDLKPVYDAGPAEGYEQTVLAMQKGALDFVKDYMEAFGEYEQEAEFRNHDAAMPFEAFIRYCSPYDRRMYEGVFIDDELWGGRRDIHLKELMEIRLRKIPDYAKEKRNEG